MELQDARRALKVIYSHSDSESSDNERSMSCPEVPGTSRPDASLKPCAERLWMRRQHREQHHTASGWKL
jgi:hypothetical protein